MTRLTIVTLWAILAVLIAIAFFQHRELSALAAQNDALKQSSASSISSSAEKQTASDAESTTISTSAQPDWFPELLQLRSKAGSQRNELTRLQAELAKAQSLAQARAEAAKNYFPKSSWATAGNATPEAALLSQQGGDANPWKLAKGLSRDQLKVLIKTIVPTEQQADAQKELDSHTDAEVADIIAQGLQQEERINGIRIVNKDVISDDEVNLTYMSFLNNGTNDGWGTGTFKRVGNQWKPAVNHPN